MSKKIEGKVDKIYQEEERYALHVKDKYFSAEGEAPVEEGDDVIIEWKKVNEKPKGEDKVRTFRLITKIEKIVEVF